MPKIVLTTKIDATIDICFDLSRSIDLHKISTAKTQEQAIAGTTKGLISLGETVTWQAIHFGIKQKLTSKITAFERPHYFVDEQISGPFKSIHHQHKFEVVDDSVLMTDVFEFQSPLGILGRVFNALVLTNYLEKFLVERNQIIKDYAESDKWKQVLVNESSIKQLES